MWPRVRRVYGVWGILGSRLCSLEVWGSGSVVALGGGRCRDLEVWGLGNVGIWKSRAYGL